MTPEQITLFYSARDARTVSYDSAAESLHAEVVLVIGAAAASRPGQVALLGLTNMMARTHRHLTIEAPSVPLVASSLITGASIAEAVSQTILAANPAARLIVNGRRVDTNDIPDPPGRQISAAIGADITGDFDMWLGWAGGRGLLDTRPVPATAADSGVLGAATAACMAAGALFQRSHNQQVRPGALNLVERTSAGGDDVATAATDAAVIGGVGISTITGPIDAGDVAIVGAGAVAHSLGWWATEFGHRGSWSVIDGDDAELSNTNRCMTMSAADAGWPAGLPSAHPRAKADVLADFLHAESVPTWFDTRTPAARPDLVLILANERGVRAQAAALGEPLLLHATTSSSWTAELHRHMPATDDCPACRIPAATTPTFACSTGPVGPEPSSGDAALPFLSAAAGLMLTVALYQLAPGEPLIAGRHNHWRMSFERGVGLHPSVHAPRCPHTLSPAARRALHTAQPRRHDHLDPVHR